MKKSLTIGIPTHNDFSGLYFTIQAIKMYHYDILNKINFLIVDSNPKSDHGKCNKEFVDTTNKVISIEYYEFLEENSTSQPRNKIFELATTPYVMCIDSHVLIEKNGIKKLINFYDANKDEGNLLQGPLLYDDGQIVTHFTRKWKDQMWGTWDIDERGANINNEPFEIPSQGLGLFSCRKTSWLKFNEAFIGFGGEECYIHEKYKKNGKKTLCLPFLRWSHRFDRPDGIHYRLKIEDRIRNYYIGHLELGLDYTIVTDHFKSIGIPEETLKDIFNNVIKDMFKTKTN